MVSLIITIIKLLAIILTVATIHEFGHFLASKLLGVGVDEFAIGFGPKIVQKKFKGTMYTLRWLPLGGYCAIEGEEATEENKDSETSYQKKNPLEKIIILSMGVIFNFILATVVFLGVYLPGTVQSTQIHGFTDSSVMAQAGMQVGDKIVSINGKKVELYSQISNFSLPKGEKDIEVVYIRDNQIFTTTVKDAQRIEGKIGVSFVTEEELITNEIEMIGAGSSSAKAGIKSGDIIKSIDGVEMTTGMDVVEYIKEKANQEIVITVLRNDEEKEFKVIPQGKEIMDLGIASLETTDSNLKYAFIETIENIKNVIGSYVDLFMGKVSLNNMSGIIGIGEVVSKSEGVLHFFYLMAMISMAVGVANILPFPPLDGGKIVLVAIEGITRKKVSENVELIISYIGLGLLLLLTLFVSFKDIIRII